MRYTHRDMPRAFRVPFGSWLIPVVGSLLCILLMKSVTKGTGYRFLIWTGIGQIVYFSYGFWNSKKRKAERMESVNSVLELLPTAESIHTTSTHTQPELDLSDET
jgi:amino acid transporter